MRIEQCFVVKAPRQRVWAFLTDPYRVAPALAGASVTEKVDDTTYNGTITVKVGPVSARYRGSVHFERLDAEGGVAEAVAKAQDMSGRGGADMRMTSRVVERSAGETEVNVVSEVNVTGLLAQLGRGMIQDVSDQMFQKFTEAVRAELERPAEGDAAASPAAPAPPIEVVSFGSQLFGRALLRAARQPLFWLAAVLASVAIYRLVFG